MHHDAHTPNASFGDYLRALPQHLLPGMLLSKLMYRFARIRTPWLKNPFTRWFAGRFRVDLDEAADPDLTAYEHFNAFFTRALKPGVRPLADGPGEICSPVDGRVSQGGAIRDGRIFQAKGQEFGLLELLGGDPELAREFAGGSFLNVYLSPMDYHRIHMPLAGDLREMIYVPGRLFSVSPATVRAVPRLFARNERVVSVFDTTAGPMAMVKVGAIFVSSTETVWAGEVGPRGSRPWRQGYSGERAVHLEHGAEMGRFNMGSTVILLFACGRTEWDPALLRHDAPLRMGQHIGQVIA